MRSDEYGAILRSISTDEEEELKTGPIGDEWTFEEIDALLDDERVPPELKTLLRISDAMLIESELAEAELILRYTHRSVRMVKPVGSPCAAVPQRLFPLIMIASSRSVHCDFAAAFSPAFPASNSPTNWLCAAHTRAEASQPLAAPATWLSHPLAREACFGPSALADRARRCRAAVCGGGGQL